eukprot:TRINITY_DN491_c0_g1_i1.p1 TRINITY_DN491_c0_g1~~TRINITY_DN491_c0_g1_i1.p1  ORF type:complete len:305 (-),score=54.36 TRINITY_DN491_c0_g1_i1:1227-2141(-)
MRENIAKANKMLAQGKLKSAQSILDGLESCWKTVDELEGDIFPSVSAGDDIDVTYGKMVSLPAGEWNMQNRRSSWSYEWKQLRGPPGVSMTGRLQANVELNNLQLGEYQFEVTVTDSYHLTSKDNVILNVIPRPVIGIDLGTTYSCIATVEYGKVVPITSPDESGICIPSVISFESIYTKVGTAAKESEYPIYDVKRFIGLGRYDKNVMEIASELPYNLVPSKSGAEIDTHYIQLPGPNPDFSWIAPWKTRREIEQWHDNHIDGKVAILPEYASSIFLAYLKYLAFQHFWAGGRRCGHYCTCCF